MLNRLRHALPLAGLLFLAVLTAAGCASGARPAGKDTTLIPFSDKVVKGTLDNDLSWFFVPNTEPAERASLRLYVKAGSLLEEEDQEGIAHLVEHMAFNGTANFSKNDIIKYMESIGMAFGPEVNAHTSFMETVYKLEIPTDDENIVRTAFQILEDWAHGITFEDSEIDKERLVIQEEWRMGLGAQRRLLYKWLPFLLKDSPYAERLPIGDMDDVLNTPAQRVRDFYRTWYTPGRMAVIVTGDLDGTLVEELVQTHFSFAPAAETPEEPEIIVPERKGTHVGIFTDPELTESRVGIYRATVVPEQIYEHNYRQGVLESLYFSLLNGRLEEYQRASDPPFLWGAGYRFSITPHSHFFGLGAGGQSEKILDAVRILLQEERKARAYGFTDAEISRKKEEILKHYKQSYDERNNRHSGSIAAELGRHFLEGESVPGIEWEYAFVRKVLDGISNEEINAYPADVGSSEDLLITVMVPDGGYVPDEEAVLNAVREGRTADVQAYEEVDIPTQLLDQPPRPGAIVTEEQIEETGITILTFENGIRAAIKDTDFKDNRIYMNAFSPGGSTLVDDEDFIPLSTAATIRRFSGVGDMDDITVKKYLDTKDLSINISISGFYEGFSGEASTEDFPAMLEMLYLLMTEPRFDQEGFSTAKARLSASLENQEKDPNYHFSNKIRELVLGESLRNRPLTRQSLEEMNLKKSEALYKERFADASDFTFVFTGNTGDVPVKQLLATYLGSLPSLNRKEKGRDLGIRPAGGIVNEKVEKSLEDKGEVALFFVRELPWSRQQAVTADAAGRILDVMLREYVREELSGTYSIGVQALTDYLPYEYTRLAVYFGCDPARVDELTKAVFDVLDKAIAEGPGQDLVDNQREQYRRSYETAVETNEYWLQFISEALREERSLKDPLDPEEYNRYVTPESVKDLLSKMYSRDEFIRVVLLPEPPVE
ncbi:MAG: insulinase family protein [Spirochaetales bacterium]|nr:insulinase family protein [Spirochaetales bacterium]